jgi:hypothetical protein
MSLGHKDDVRRFMEESHPDRANCTYWLLGKKEGFRHDYGHIDMLTHPDCISDHFPKVLSWLKAH